MDSPASRGCFTPIGRRVGGSLSLRNHLTSAASKFSGRYTVPYFLGNFKGWHVCALDCLTCVEGTQNPRRQERHSWKLQSRTATAALHLAPISCIAYPWHHPKFSPRVEVLLFNRCFVLIATDCRQLRLRICSVSQLLHPFRTPSLSFHTQLP